MVRAVFPPLATLLDLRVQRKRHFASIENTRTPTYQTFLVPQPEPQVKGLVLRRKSIIFPLPNSKVPTAGRGKPRGLALGRTQTQNGFLKSLEGAETAGRGSAGIRRAPSAELRGLQ